MSLICKVGIIMPIVPTSKSCEDQMRSFWKDLLSSYYVPGTVLGTGITKIKLKKSLPSRSLHFIGAGVRLGLVLA